MKDTNVTIFTNEEFGDIRTIMINNEPWFVGKDIAEILKYTNTAKAVRDHVDDEDKLTERIVLSGQNREVIVINESGLYSLILSSKLPMAKKFKRWITSEVLPTLRKTGSYSLETKLDSYMIDDPVDRAKRWIEEYEEKKQLAAENIKMIQKIEEDKPMVDFANAVSLTKDVINIEEMAKLLNADGYNIGRNRLFKWLKKNNILMNNNVPYQVYINNGYFKVREVTKNTINGAMTFRKTYITGKGQIWLTNKFKELYSLLETS